MDGPLMDAPLMDGGRGPGPLALMGSGEFLPGMEELDRRLLAGRPGRVVHLATAAGLEGDARIAYWEKLAAEHYGRLGVAVETLPVHGAADAADDAVADRVAGAGLVVMSGGKPSHLVEVLRDSVLWEAICRAWRSGTALAGCSAGAMAMSAALPAFRSAAGEALGLLDTITVLPHYDRFGAMMRPVARIRGRDLTVLGIDEHTAVFGGPHDWEVYGAGRVHVFQDGRHTIHPADATFHLACAGG